MLPGAGADGQLAGTESVGAVPGDENRRDCYARNGRERDKRLSTRNRQRDNNRGENHHESFVHAAHAFTLFGWLGVVWGR